MTTHKFLLTPGTWIGEGKVTFSASPEEVRFFTKWEIKASDGSDICCTQQVEMHGVDEKVTNHFKLSLIDNTGFTIVLHNEMIDKVVGKGLIEEEKIAWEFREHENFEGFEVYKRQQDNTYSMHAEYASIDHFRTIIDGIIWPKTIE